MHAMVMTWALVWAVRGDAVEPPGHGPSAPPSADGRDEVDGADDVTLVELLRMLRRESPRVRAEQAHVEVAAARKEGARAYPNPVFNFSVLHLLSGYNQNGFGTYTVFVQQPLLVGRQRVHRDRAARAAERAATTEFEDAFHEIAATGRHLWVELLACQERRRLIADAIGDLERVAKVVEARHGSGAESRYDVARIDLEVAEWRAAVVAADVDIRDTAGRLGVLVGRPDWQPRANGALAPVGVDDDRERAWAEIEASHPRLRAARAAEALAERELTVARRDALPQPTIGFGVVGIDNFFSMSAVGSVIVPLPLLDWGQGSIARAKAEITVARSNEDAVVAEHRAELDRAATVLQQRERALRHFEDDILGRTPELQRMAEDAYVTGQASILELIDATSTRYELAITRQELTEQVMHAEIDLLVVQGRVEEVR